MSHLVEFQSVFKGYGGKSILSDFNLAVEEGEFLTLLGPSGCGKTTALRLLAGFERPDAGQIRLAGNAINEVPPERRPVNTVFQSYALFPHMSVADNIGFGLHVKGVTGRRLQDLVAEMLERMHLQGLERRKPGELSGGQQQRVALARALINQPRVLLLDEPLSALDHRLRKSLQASLKRLQRELGVTFIFVTHDQEEALSISDRIAVMRAGQIHQLGTPREIYERPENLFVASFVGEGNLLEATVLGLAEPGRARVRLGRQERWLPTPHHWEAGESARVLIRPEDLRLQPLGPNEPPEAGLAGVVRERIFRGVIEEILIGLDSGQTLRASHVFSDGKGAGEDLQLGQRVAVQWVSGRETVLKSEALG